MKPEARPFAPDGHQGTRDQRDARDQNDKQEPELGKDKLPELLQGTLDVGGGAGLRNTGVFGLRHIGVPMRRTHTNLGFALASVTANPFDLYTWETSMEIENCKEVLENTGV